MNLTPEYTRGWLSGSRLAKDLIGGEDLPVKSTLLATTGPHPGAGDPVSSVLGELLAGPAWIEQTNPALYKRLLGDEKFGRDSDEEVAYWEGVEEGVRAADIEHRAGGKEADR